MDVLILAAFALHIAGMLLGLLIIASIIDEVAGFRNRVFGRFSDDHLDSGTDLSP